MLVRCRSFRVTCLASCAVLAGLMSAGPAQSQEFVPYRGTAGPDRIDFRNETRSYDIKALGGDDLVYAGRAPDIIDGGDGRDTINPGGGNDVVRGGKHGDYFRYETLYDGFRYLTEGFDIICDFASGDKIDVYTTFLDDNGSPDHVRGGNFKLFDTNGDGVIDKKDRFSSVQKAKCGKSKDSLVLDLTAAFEEHDDRGPPEGEGKITIFNKKSLKKKEFVADYFRDHPY